MQAGAKKRPSNRTKKRNIKAKTMAEGRNKYQSRENRAKVRQVLMETWDPIGVRDVPQAQDEYDAYVGKVYVMLIDERVSPRAIAAYLYDIATNYMGLSPSPDLETRSARAANLIVDLRPGFETH
jgi:hypothetical protein